MKKATKEKKSLNNRNKTGIKKTNNTGIFNYDSEVSYDTKIAQNNKNKKTKLRKPKNKVTNYDNDEYLFMNNNINVSNNTGASAKSNKEKVKKLQKRKNKEKAQITKEIQIAQKKEIVKQRKVVKKKKVNQKSSKAIKNTFIIVLLITAIFLFVLSPIFNISQITVSNNNKVTREEVIGLVNLDNTTNIFKESNEEIKEKLKENPYINVEKTKIRRLLPATLLIDIVEREPEFLLEFGSTLAYVDKDGYILEISNETIDGKVKVIGYSTSVEYIKPGNKLCDEDISKIKDIIQIVNISKNYKIYEKITSINMKDKNDYQLFIESEKKTVHLGNNTSMDTKMMYVKAIMEKEKDNEGEIFVNVDLNNKNAYFKQKV